MAENTKFLKRRLRSVKSTMQITSAMEMVSAAKLRRTQNVLMAGRPYSAKLQELLGRLAQTAAPAHPFFERREVRRRMVVVVTADRGLAGAFNTQVVKRAEALIRESREPVALFCVGKKGADYFRTRHGDIAGTITDFGGTLRSDSSNRLGEELAGAFLKGEVDEVLLVYNSFVSTMQYRTRAEQLLPLEPEELLKGAPATGGPGGEYILEPDAQRVFEQLLPRYLRNKVYITLAETFTAEHSARMVAMSGATKNCEDLINKLTLRINKARQAAITKEILEIVSGAEALKG
jgi:F-type H+-transporting ATPase subunit gamma